MSWRIYQAWRLNKRVNLPAFLREVRLKAQERAVKQIRARAKEADRYLCSIKTPTGARAAFELMCPEASIPPAADLVVKFHETYHGGTRPGYVSNYMHGMYVKSKTKHLYAAAWDFDTSLDVHTYEGRYYLLPRTRTLDGVFDFLDRHPACQDFHYQTRSDHQVNNRISWKERHRVWSALDAHSPHRLSLWHDAVVLPIVTLNNFISLTPYYYDAVHRIRIRGPKPWEGKKS